MPIAVGVAKQLRFKKQTALGTLAGTSGGQILRRVSSSVDLSKAAYESAEIRSDYQIADMRHGARSVGGTIEGELSPGTFSAFFGSLLRRDFTAGASTGALTNVTAAAGPPGTFTRAAGSFLTDGIKVNDVVRWTGWTTTGAANNARNYRVTSLTATVMNVTGIGDEVVAAKTAGDSVTCTVVGKKSFANPSNQTNDFYTLEHWFADIAQSETFQDCRITQATLQLPPTGMATVSFGVLGTGQMLTATSAYFTAPSAETTSGILAAVNGFCRVAGSDVGYVTGAQLTIDGGYTTQPVIGSNFAPDVFAGRIRVSGQITAFFQDATLRDLFINETETSIALMLETGTGLNADFIAITLSRLKFGGAQKNDGEQGLLLTMPFSGLIDTAGGTGIATERTTITMQDSLA